MIIYACSQKTSKETDKWKLIYIRRPNKRKWIGYHLKHVIIVTQYCVTFVFRNRDVSTQVYLVCSSKDELDLLIDHNILSAAY
ncbi:hypothetical protein FN924_01170 [Radiobacillus deserti]|uniref:Uncharacterized protein n=1 Tax=Radiobacillus deserti TaxID=2594883 RepID=A0A516KC76_9BACI|nr:hypothetical protein FN924_01170 [Radiobacillus deserti]